MHEILKGKKKISMKWLSVEVLINYCSPVMLLSVAARWQDCAWESFFLLLLLKKRKPFSWDYKLQRITVN